MATLGVLGPVQQTIILLFIILMFLLPIIALIDIVKSQFEGNTKLLWVIIVIFVNIIGAILYFTIGKNQKLLK